MRRCQWSRTRRKFAVMLCVANIASVSVLGDAGSGEEYVSYSDSDYGIFFEYPTSWKVKAVCQNSKDDPDYIVKRSLLIANESGHSAFLVDIWSNHDGVGLLDWFNMNYRQLMSVPADAPGSINAEFKGLDALRFINRQMTTCDMDVLLFEYDGWVYTLVYRQCDGGAAVQQFERFVQSFLPGGYEE